jgi:hypothetical protein
MLTAENFLGKRKRKARARPKQDEAKRKMCQSSVNVDENTIFNVNHNFNGKTKSLQATFVLCTAAFLLFARLGHYALWDDEAGLAIPARGVWQTGDTSIVAGHNIVAPRQGLLARDLRDRANPPLPAYVVAPFVAFSGTGAFLPRLPFALCGLACVGLLLWWLKRDKADGMTSLLMVFAILGNVSFFLYFRQARYYGITILCSVAAAYIYLHWNGSRRGLLGLSLLFLAILASHYMTFAALAGAVTVDYIFWQRHVRRLRPRDWLLLLAPVGALSAIIVSIWNPFLLPGILKQIGSNSLGNRVTLFWWNLRDLNRNEFSAGILILLSPVLYFVNGKNPLLLRGAVCIAIYCFVMATVSPQPVRETSVADVRYLIPLIPLCMALGAAVVRILTRGAPAWLCAALGVVAFGTNLLNGGLFFQEGLRSTAWCFAKELISPPNDPYTETANWINKHVEANASIWVLPDYMAYPLIYHAPKAIYAWQLGWPPEPQFRDLPAVHFQGQKPPDYIICFGPVVQGVMNLVQHWLGSGIQYERAATIDFFWKDLYRPELFWRSFRPVVDYNKNLEAIYVFKRESF